MTATMVDLSVKPDVKGFFDPGTNTISYVVKDPNSTSCAIIDSVLDFDFSASRVSYERADEIIADIEARGLSLEWLIETHVHADHLSAAPYIREKLGGKIGIGARITEVQETFAKIFNEASDFDCSGGQFDVLFDDGATYAIGGMTATALSTPGHTPACMTHIVGDAAFVGDTLFMPDQGSARADFPGGDAGILYDSIQTLLALPDELRLFMCHDYGPNGREIAWETTVGDERARNIHVGAGATRETFIQMRLERDETLSVPRLILPSLQVNMRAGHVPEDETGRPMLKLPVNAL